MGIDSPADQRRTRPSPGFATRLAIAQALVLVAGAATLWIVANSVGPGIFHDHLQRAGVSLNPSELSHVEIAFGSALVLALGVALLISVPTALAATWFLSRKVHRSINAVTESAAQIATGAFHNRVARSGLGTEFDQLTTTINGLAERLDTVERTRRRMLADLAHEMRTPIATIGAHLEAIEDGVRSADTETLSVLRASNDRLGLLASDISTVSKAEEGQFEVTLEPVRAADLVATAIAASRARADGMDIELVEHLATETVVLADPVRMAQVLGNLLDNAIRHSPSGGSITVSCRQIDWRWVEISVTDEGDGIAPEHIGHVFDRFYRADTARNRSQGGSGIGLTITRALVGAHGGHISATSLGVGRGSTFTTRLPTAG